MTRRIIPTSLFLLLLSGLSGAAGAQSYNDKYPLYTLANTEQRVLHSESNGITYKLYISLPRITPPELHVGPFMQFQPRLNILVHGNTFNII